VFVVRADGVQGVQALLNGNRAAAESPKERSFMNTVREVFRGERSLAETWWIWKLLIGNLGIGVGLGSLAGVLRSVTHSSLPIYLLFAICLPYNFWISAGCIRSASGCTRSASNRQRFWGWVVVILFCLEQVAMCAWMPAWVRLLKLYW
jgi:hypothetical protein